MPNILHALVNFAYAFALAIWIGGGIALGALTAPELFRQLPRQQAGGVFGAVLRRFAGLRLGAIAVAIIAAAVGSLLWPVLLNPIVVALRWLCLLFMAGAVTYEIYGLQPAMERYRSSFRQEGVDDDPSRRAFMSLHLRSERLMKISLFSALIALLLS